MVKMASLILNHICVTHLVCSVLGVFTALYNIKNENQSYHGFTLSPFLQHVALGRLTKTVLYLTKE
jgi:hypothetical protein